MMRRIGLLSILAMAVAVLGGCRPKEGATIACTGTIEMTSVTVAVKAGGTVQRVLVEEGQAVKAGLLLAELDHDDLDAQLASAEAALEAAQVRVRQSRTNYQLAREQSAAQTQQAEAGVETASQRLRLTETGARRQELEMAQTAVDQARIQLDLARKNRARQQALFDEQLIAQAQLDQAVSQEELAEAQYQSAVSRLSLVQAGAREEEIAIAASQDRQASAGLSLARSGEKTVNLRLDEIALAEAQVRQAAAAVDLLRVLLAQRRILAPVDGLIASQLVQAGETIVPGAGLFSLLDVNRPWLKVFLPLTQVERVKVGERVRITLDAFPHKVFLGKVVQIATEAEFTPRNFQTKEERVKQVFAVKIAVSNQDGLLKAGMPADAVIEL